MAEEFFGKNGTDNYCFYVDSRGDFYLHHDLEAEDTPDDEIVGMQFYAYHDQPKANEYTILPLLK